jgi:hypothetical protein
MLQTFEILLSYFQRIRHFVAFVKLLPAMTSSNMTNVKHHPVKQPIFGQKSDSRPLAI